MKLLLFIPILLMLSCQKEEGPKSRPSTLTQKKLGGEITLAHKSGEWKLSSTNGKLRVLYFGFTTCPDICPMALTKLSKVLKRLSPEQFSQVQPVFISVDWKRDTPQSVDEYVDFFGKGYIGLTGSESQIKKVAEDYGVFFEFVPLKDSALKYTVDHTSRYYVIDKQGNFYKSYSNITDEPNFIVDITTLLRK
ncbi:MAG: SCO family protein [Deltaproteobacteria bacterium]|nr:MAG: SCO family protein [Deltaproteobacteria bacterium]TNF26258.1 MAG: SCO family protein [Deltaproteobacteria bacterium]